MTTTETTETTEATIMASEITENDIIYVEVQNNDGEWCLLGNDHYGVTVDEVIDQLRHDGDVVAFNIDVERQLLNGRPFRLATEDAVINWDADDAKGKPTEATETASWNINIDPRHTEHTQLFIDPVNRRVYDVEDRVTPGEAFGRRREGMHIRLTKVHSNTVFPQLAEWLQAHADMLDAVVEGFNFDYVDIDEQAYESAQYKLEQAMEEAHTYDELSYWTKPEDWFWPEWTQEARISQLRSGLAAHGDDIDDYVTAAVGEAKDDCIWLDEAKVKGWIEETLDTADDDDDAASDSQGGSTPREVR